VALLLYHPKMSVRMEMKKLIEIAERIPAAIPVAIIAFRKDVRAVMVATVTGFYSQLSLPNLQNAILVRVIKAADSFPSLHSRKYFITIMRFVGYISRDKNARFEA
jgi:hypothetical protein